MAEKLPKMPDVKSTNPRYKAAMMSDVARALVTDPKVRARLEERRAKRGGRTPVNSTG